MSRRSLRCVYLPLSALLVACAPAGDEEPAAPAAPAVEAAPGTALELRVSPLVDLWFDARAGAASRAGDAPQEGDAPGDPGAAAGEDAVRAALALQESLGSWGGWGPLDSSVLVATDADDLIEDFRALDEPYERRGREISIRDDAVRLATALRDRLPAYVEGGWRDRGPALEAKVAALEAGFMKRHREALAYMMRSLGIADPGITVPVYLVTATNPPGAMTYFLFGGEQASVIETRAGGSDAILRETVLHEACHALDLASENEGSAFAALRAMLEARGLTRRDRDWHTIPHTLMFVQAEETIRRLFDPGHVAYGDATDLYERTGEIAVVEREIWPRHLDGELTREEALRAIVDRLVPGPPAE